jgi:hypothetical protein
MYILLDELPYVLGGDEASKQDLHLALSLGIPVMRSHTKIVFSLFSI